MTKNTSGALRACVVTVSLLAASGLVSLGLVVTPLAQTQQPLNPVGGQPGGPPVKPKPGGPLTPSDTTYKIDAIEFFLTPDQFVEYKFRLKTGQQMIFNWKASAPIDVLTPETSYECPDLPNVPSQAGEIEGRAKQMRDPAIFEEDGRSFLFYTICGEQGIAAAEIEIKN